MTNQISDLSEKLEQGESQVNKSGSFSLNIDPDKRDDGKLAKATKDSCKTGIEAIHGLMSQTIKDSLFNKIGTTT